MFQYALKSLRANATRLIATALAVIVGIGFLAAGLMLTDAMQDGLTGTAEQQYEGVDLVVSTGIGSSDMGFVQGLPPETLALVRATDGVDAAEGEVTADVRVRREDGSSVNLRSKGRGWIDDEALNPLVIIEGSAPAAAGEVALDRGLAADREVGVGDRVELTTPLGVREVTVVGITEFGRAAAMDDGGTISYNPQESIEVLGSTSGYAQILVRTGEPAGAVAQRIQTALPQVQVQTSAEAIESSTELAAAFLTFLRPVLQGFAYLALFVAAFVIFNTFSVVVTQRFRELALIRAVGGTPSQVRRSLIIEGFGIGVVASALGIVAGGLIALLVQWALGRFDIVLPGSGVKVTIGTVVLCMLAGTIVTVLSVIVPAFRAGRTKPVEAMRSSAIDSSGTSMVRAVIGGAFLALAALFLVLNTVGDAKWYLIGPGALCLFIGTFVGGPLLARVFALGLSPVMRRIGMTGRLASDNLVRNPRRTATTANALVIGLFLVSLVTVSGEAMKSYAVGELNKLSSSDYIVASTGAIPEELASSIDDIDGVAASAPIRSSATTDTSSGLEYYVATGDFDRIEQTAGIALDQGDMESVINGRGLAEPDIGSSFGGSESGMPSANLGSVYSLKAADGTSVDLTVDAILTGELDALFIGTLVGAETFEMLVGEQPINMVFVRTEPGAANAVGPRIETLLEDYTGVEVIPGNFLGQIVGTVFDFLIGAVNGLLGMSVLVALVGIINTMTLAIFERRRELGMVRALGMTRQQVGRMVRAEAVLISILGTIIGVGSGILLSWVLVSSLGDDIGLSFNWARVGLIVLVGLGVGVLASILPAWRATRLDMLEAMKET